MAFLPKLKRWISKCCVRNPGLFVGTKDIKGNECCKDFTPDAKVTLDPDPPRRWLFPFEDQSKVRYGDKHLEMVNNPEGFGYYYCVLGHEGFAAGRHFWEATVENAETWSFTVASRCPLRKGHFDLRSAARTWNVRLEDGEYRAGGFRVYSVLSPSEKPKRVRVTLDYEGGCLSFSDADSGAELYTFSEDSFSGEALFPFIKVWGKVDNFRISWGD